jgi:hypothetical protein
VQGILAGFHENVNKKIFIYSTPPVPPAFPPGFCGGLSALNPMCGRMRTNFKECFCTKQKIRFPDEFCRIRNYFNCFSDFRRKRAKKPE